MLGLTVGSVIVYAHIPFIGRFAHIFGRMRVFARHPSCGPMQLDANPHRQFLIRQVSSILEHLLFVGIYSQIKAFAFSPFLVLARSSSFRHHSIVHTKKLLSSIDFCFCVYNKYGAWTLVLVVCSLFGIWCFEFVSYFVLLEGQNVHHCRFAALQGWTLHASPPPPPHYRPTSAR